MFFEGLPQQHLGGTVILRGAARNELIKVKRVASFYLFAHYNWRLEKSFLMDEYALPPKDDIFDDSKENSPLLQLSNKTAPKTKQNANDVKEAIANDKGVFKEPVETFSDPLRDFENGVYKASGHEKLSVAELPFSNEFRKALNGTILSVSPYIAFSMPYLETELGRKCKLRSFFPEEIFYSTQFVRDRKHKYVEADSGDNDNNSVSETVVVILICLSVFTCFFSVKPSASIYNSEINNERGGQSNSEHACEFSCKRRKVQKEESVNFTGKRRRNKQKKKLSNSH